MSEATKVQFLSRVASFPLVESAIGIAGERYNRIKGYNNLVGSTLNLGERSIQFVTETAKPMVATFEKPITYADKLACQGLDKLEGAVPIIKEKPEDLVKYGTERVESLKQYGYEKVNNALATPYGQVVARSIDSAVTMTENTVDRYLPRSEDEPEELSAPHGNRNVVQRVGVLSEKMRRRMYKQTMNQLGTVQRRTQQALDHMKFSVNLIEIARNFDPVVAVTNPAKWFWEELNKEEEQPQQGETQKLDKRVLNIARRATKEVLTRFQEISTLRTSLTETARKTLDASIEHARGIYDQLLKAKTVRDISELTVNEMIIGLELMQAVVKRVFTAVVQRYSDKQVGPGEKKNH